MPSFVDLPTAPFDQVADAGNIPCGLVKRRSVLDPRLKPTPQFRFNDDELSCVRKEFDVSASSTTKLKMSNDAICVRPSFRARVPSLGRKKLAGEQCL